jgi:PAS domain S-box-containing protein
MRSFVGSAAPAKPAGAGRLYAGWSHHTRQFFSNCGRLGLGAAELGLDGRWLRANGPFCAITGYTERELRDLTFRDLTLASDIEPENSLLRRMLAGEIRTYSVEKRYICKDGSHAWTQVTASLMPGVPGGPRHVDVIVQDITRRKQKEEARDLLIASLEDQLRERSAVMASIGAAVLLLDKSWRFVYVSSEARRIFSGQGRAEPEIGRRIWDYFPKLAGCFRGTELARSLAEKTPVVFLTPDLCPGRWMEVHIHPFEAFVSLHIVDVTRWKAAVEGAIAGAREEKLFLRESHHRIKNNLQVLSSLFGLQAKLAGDERIRSALQQAQSRTKSIALIHTYLYQSYDLKELRLRDYVQDIITHLLHSYGIDSGKIRLVVNVDDLTFVPEKAVPCGLIINELVSNALKYAFPAGRSGEIRVECHAEQPGGFVLAVSDNGVGMPQTLDLQSIESLGLRLVTALNEQLDGRMELDTTAGTTFTIRFPQSKHPGAA